MLRSISRAASAACFSVLCAAVAHAQWQQNGNDLFYDQGRVGVGTAPATASILEVLAGDPDLTKAINASHYSEFGAAIWGTAASDTGPAAGVVGRTHSIEGVGVYGQATSPTGTGYGIYGKTWSPSGYAAWFEGGKSVFDCDYVGIGRSTPLTGAEVFGVRATTTGYGGMYMEVLGANAMPFYGYSSGTSSIWHYYDSTTSQWRLYAGGVRLAVERSSGRVGIGTTSPAFLLHVNGTAGKPGGGSWSSASDARLKCNVQPLESTLDRILRLRGVSFEYLDPEAIHELPGTQIGMLAQEVEPVFPEWVEAGDDGFLRLTFRGFEALTVEALRDLRAEKDCQIEALAIENEALRSRLERLEARVELLARAR